MKRDSIRNEMHMRFLADSVNESLARIAVASFVAELNPTMEEIEDIRTAVSEAVTNAIIHGYENTDGQVELHCMLLDKRLHIEVKDSGKGIADIQQAKKPFYTTKPQEERSGMGFAFMEAFMDVVKVESEVDFGTRVIMEKEIGTVQNE